MEDSGRGHEITARVLAREPDGRPMTVQIGERVFRASDDQSREWRLVEERRLESSICHAAGEGAGRVSVLLREYWALHHQREDERLIEALRDFGRFLVDQRLGALWKVYFLTLRERESTTDLVAKVIGRDRYEAHDELCFVWGDDWETYRESQEEVEEAREGAQSQTSADAPPAEPEFPSPDSGGASASALEGGAEVRGSARQGAGAASPAAPAGFREAEMRWLETHQEELLARYRGRWIAIDGDALVADADGLMELLRLAADGGHPDPFVTAVPAEPRLWHGEAR